MGFNTENSCFNREVQVTTLSQEGVYATVALHTTLFIVLLAETWHSL